MTDVLSLAEALLQSQVRPKAQEIDGSPDALRVALQGLCDRELMALRRPEAYGGPALNEAQFRQFQESVARYSGSLAFLQTQHQSASSMIAKSSNDALKAEYLPKMGNGEKLVGIGFSQLRRAGPPIMRAEPATGGYRLYGSVPWITGYTFYPEFLIGAALPDGRAVFGVVPFEPRGDLQRSGDPLPSTPSSWQGASQLGGEKNPLPSPPPSSPWSWQGEGIWLSEPMKLAAMESALTVSGEFQNWFLPEEKVVFIQSEDWIKNNDMINITLQGHFALGCARAGLDILQEASEKKALPFLQDALTSLDQELEECRKETTSSQGRAIEERLKVRAWAIDLAVRCAHAAVTASSGAANSIRHPAQRVYREALVYTVSAQTADIMEATLRRLVGRTT